MCFGGPGPHNTALHPGLGALGAATPAFPGGRAAVGRCWGAAGCSCHPPTLKFATMVKGRRHRSKKNHFFVCTATTSNTTLMRIFCNVTTSVPRDQHFFIIIIIPVMVKGSGQTPKSVFSNLLVSTRAPWELPPVATSTFAPESSVAF